MTTHNSGQVTVARVLRPHGRRGEVACEILTDFPDHLTHLRTIRLCAENREPRSVAVRSCRLSPSRGGQAILHFEGSDSISEAEKLVGLEVQIPFEDRIKLSAGSYYVTDLIDCEVHDRAFGPIGSVRDVQFTGESVPGTPVLVLDSRQGELLIPFAQEICFAIDVTSRRIDVALPEGLLDLNRDS